MYEPFNLFFNIDRELPKLMLYTGARTVSSDIHFKWFACRKLRSSQEYDLIYIHQSTKCNIQGTGKEYFHLEDLHPETVCPRQET
jgi:hypothetical protein